MNTRDHTPNAPAKDLAEDVKEELLHRAQSLPNETLIPGDKAFEELNRTVVGRIRRPRFPRRWPWSLFYVVNDDNRS
jgi:hypothetical protein